jgi:hypothetical protein
MSVYKLDSRLPPICDLKKDFTSLLPLKDISPQFSWWNTHVDIFHNFVDDVIKWALVDAKSEILLDTLHATNHDPAIYSTISILLTLSVNSLD